MANSHIAVVTGATGFIGSALVAGLAREDWSVHALVRPSSNTGALIESARDVSVHIYDGSLASVSAALKRANPDVVFHLASLFFAEHTPEDVDRLLESNVRFGSLLLEAMAQNHVRLLVNTSTSWQHFENQDYGPVNLYAATKQAFEDIVQYYVEVKKLSAITLVLYDSYGPHDKRRKLFYLLDKAYREKSVLKMSRGEQWMDLVYVDDVVAAYERAAQILFAKPVGQVKRFAVSSGHPIRLRDLVRLYVSETGRELTIDWGGRPYRSREVMRPWNRGVPLPGWSPVVSLQEGIRRMYGQ